MGLFSGADNSKAKGKSPVIPFPSEFLPPPPTAARQRVPSDLLRVRPSQPQRVNVPVHQVEWHWQHRVPLPYPDATLSHDWHLDPERILVSAVPRSARAHTEEVRCQRALLTPEQRRDPSYATDLSNWARWFAFEHEEARRRDVREVDRTVPPPPLIIREEDQAPEAAYQADLAVVYQESEEDERRRAAAVEHEEEAYEADMALSAVGDCVLLPVTPSSPVKAEPEPKPSPIEHYSWTGVVHEWVIAPPVWVGATPA
ncbi:Pre-mRNA-processing factor 39 [Hordeum vulgare]|nr:Pre-mRNA-processing factor 39 [Hordeum vulgare]